MPLMKSSQEDDKMENESIASEIEFVEDIPPICKQLKLSATHPIIACSSAVKASDGGRSISTRGPSTSGVEIDAAAEEPGIFESGKDGTIWLKLADEDKRVRRQSQNVIKHVPGPTREAKARIITPFDALKCLLDVTLISWIVSYTELEATR